MWSDEIDKKIQDGAGSHEPPFREDDWNRMHALLDKHLPQEKKKRPLIWGFLLFLLVGIPAAVMLTTYKVHPENPPVTQTTSNVPSTNDEPKKSLSTPAGKNTAGGITGKEKTTNGADHSLKVDQEQTIRYDNTKAPVEQTDKRATTAYTSSVVKQKNKPLKLKSSEVSGIETQEESPAKEGSSPDAPSGNGMKKSQTISEISTSVEATNALSIENPVDSLNNVKKEAKDSSTEQESPAKKGKKPGEDKSGKWQISLSVGPDLSMVGMEKTGQWKMQYGVGVSYALSDRLQIRTGFMVSRKLYYADSSDYHPPKGFWNYYTNLEKIDANCLVYEIPLNIVYTFPSKKKHQWFVSTGLSSYLMKQETYEYYFKDNWGVPMYRERTIQNENDHFFSILQLSGGYQYKFSDRLSLMAEPYAKLPLGGVGFGKVKLNNTGVLFTLGFKPFVKRK